MSIFSQFTLKTVAIKVWFKSFYWNCNHKPKSYAQWKLFCFILDCVCVCAFLSICVSLCVYDNFPISLVISTCVDLDPHIYIWISCVIQNTEKESNAYQWIWWLYEMLNSPLKTCLERWCQVFTPVTWVSPQNMNDKCLYRFFQNSIDILKFEYLA